MKSKRKKEQLSLFLFSFCKAAEEALFESPEEIKLPEDKSIKQEEQIIHGQDEDPVSYGIPGGITLFK